MPVDDDAAVFDVVGPLDEALDEVTGLPEDIGRDGQQEDLPDFECLPPLVEAE